MQGLRVPGSLAFLAAGLCWLLLPALPSAGPERVPCPATDLSPKQLAAILRQWNGPSSAAAGAALAQAGARAAVSAEEGQALFAAVIKDHPETWQAEVALYWWCAYEDQRGFPERALAAYKKVIQADPESEAATWAKLRIAWLYQWGLDRPEEARAP